ncbi:hypothetical protein HanIR_Chr16g0833561 [Helianthus annuus]|nr:hypothetical protein HanIR_Chr16g0833561 [Helianthus annuus]
MGGSSLSPLVNPAWLSTNDMLCALVDPSANKGFAISGNVNLVNVCWLGMLMLGMLSWAIGSSIEMRLWRRWMAEGRSMMVALGLVLKKCSRLWFHS